MRRSKLAALAALAISGFPVGTLTADTSDTPLAHAFIQEHGSNVGVQQMLRSREIYTDYIRQAGHPKADKVADIAYGSHARHRLDVFKPLGVTAPAPILVFVHGGGFVSGDKGDGHIFDNVLDYFAARGIMGVNINYRLAPEHGWPAAVEDIRDVLRWLHRHAPEYGGDPQRVFLMGHSAGAAHVAGYAFIESLQFDHGNDGVRGAILVSGTYSGLDANASHPYYGDGLTPDSVRLPANNVDGRRMPLFIIDAEYDYPKMQLEAVELLERVCRRDGRCPRHQQVPGHNHYSILHHVNSADDSIAYAIAGFIGHWGAVR